MAINKLEFVKNNLVVSYQASREPQELHIQIETGGTTKTVAAAGALRGPFDTINLGAAGGAEFPPWEGHAEEVGFSFSDRKLVYGPNYTFTLRVRGVSHLFMRAFVEELRIAGWEHPVRRLSIIGSQPIVDPTTSATAREIRAWIDDPTAYPTAWPAPGFPITLAERDKGSVVEIELADKISPQVQWELDTMLAFWPNVILNYLDDSGNQVMPTDLIIPRVARKRRTIVASYEQIRQARVPCCNSMINMLSRFHHKVAKIVSARVAI